MRWTTELPFGNGELAVHTTAREREVAAVQLQRSVLHNPYREIYTQQVHTEAVCKDPLPRSTWYVSVRVTKHDTWATIASGISETQAIKSFNRLSELRYEERKLYAIKIGREVS